jgi:hypothetical protein
VDDAAVVGSPSAGTPLTRTGAIGKPAPVWVAKNDISAHRVGELEPRAAAEQDAGRV